MDNVDQDLFNEEEKETHKTKLDHMLIRTALTSLTFNYECNCTKVYMDVYADEDVRSRFIVKLWERVTDSSNANRACVNVVVYTYESDRY